MRFFLYICITANVHDSQNGEFYFRTVFHFRTNHEAAGSRTGSGAFRHVTLNWFLPENHCFLDVHFSQNCHSRMKKQDGHKKLRSWWLFLAWQGQTFRRRCTKWKYNLKTWWHTFLAHFRLHKRIWMRINLRIGWYFLHNIVKTEDWDFTTSVNFLSCPAQLEPCVTAWNRPTSKRLRISWKNTYKDYIYVQSEDKGLIVSCSCS